jgi:branched-subunit amino acid transport protein
MLDKSTLWIVIIGLAVGSFLFRFGFIGLVGNRPLPDWLLRHLRYTAVAFLPALIAPIVLWPAATGGVPDLPRATAAFATLAAGLVTKNLLISIIVGAGTLFGMLYLMG